MELRHIYTFQAIVKEGSFLRAAEKLQYAQSTITLHVQQLEAELGVKLFARQGKKIELTEAGRALQGQADSLAQQALALQQAMIDVVAGEVGHIRLGSIEPTASMRLPQMLVSFCQERPKVHLTLEVGGTGALSQRVAAGVLDIAICPHPLARWGLVFEPLFIEPMALLLHEQNELAAKETIDAADLREQRMLLTERGCMYRAVIETELLQQGTNPYSGLELGSIEVLKRTVQAGLGVAIVPIAAANPLPEHTVLRHVQGVDLNVPIGLVYTPGQVYSGRPFDTLLTLLRERLGALRLSESEFLAKH